MAKVVKKHEGQAGNESLHNGVKLVGEVALLPGTSLLLDGEVVEGGAHALLGLAAGAFFGPLGYFLVAANSYSKSVTGTALVDRVSSSDK